MRKFRLSVLALAVAGAAMLVGCDSPEKMKNVPQEAMPKMNPNPLVLKGKTVEGKISGVFPPKYFHKKAKLELVPVVMYEGGEMALPSKTYQGESVTDNNPVINQATGGAYSIPFTFDYKDAMMASTVELRMNLYYKGERMPFDKGIKVGVGIDATQLLVETDMQPMRIAATYNRESEKTTEAQINFAIQRPDIRRGELTKDDVKAFEAALGELSNNEKEKLKGISISAYASPDGPAALNDRLSKGRGSNTQRWLSTTLRKSKVDPKLVSVDKEATDWEGFKSMVEASDIQDKDMILRVLSMYSDPAVRNREMHNLGKVFQTLAEDILPKLRRAKMVASYEVQGYTDDELRSMVVDNENIKKLSLTEALYGISLLSDLDDCEKAYKALRENGSDDIAIDNNLAYIYIKTNRLSEAKDELAKASEKNADNPAVINNLGVIAAREGNMDEAKRLFARVTDADPVVKANMGICAIESGDYSSAAQYLTGSNTFNEGLTDLLLDKNEAARNVFTTVKSAKSYYGLAIIGARTNDEKMVVDNMRTAIQMDSNLKARAQKDVCFAKYAQNELFANLLK